MIVAPSGKLVFAERSLTVPLASRRLGRPISFLPGLFPEHDIRRKNQKETSMRGGFSLEKFGMGIGRGSMNIILTGNTGKSPYPCGRFDIITSRRNGAVAVPLRGNKTG